MKILSSPKQIREWRASVSSRTSVGFVPTMGALHSAHLALVKNSKRDNKITVASVFVNPTQFGPNEDFGRYPRPFESDCRLLSQERIDVLFAPTKEGMYASGHATDIVVRGVTETLDGAPTSRGPQHFIGVATVVTKLFNLVRPTRAYFGLKDFQQVRVIEQMTSDLNMDVSIVRCPTVREKDGLAMSSRNAYLSVDERLQAPRLYQALQSGAKLLRSRSRMTPRAVCHKVQSILTSHPSFKIDYIELVDSVTLKRQEKFKRPALLAAAVKIGKTRLIDNIEIS